MKHIDYLYFNIFNYFQKSGLDRQSFNSRIQAMYIFSLGLGGWLLLLESSYLHFVKHARFSNRGASALFAASLYFLTALLFNYIFITKERDLKIFGKYEMLSEENPNRKLHLTLSIGILILPYLGLGTFAIFFPRYGQ